MSSGFVLDEKYTRFRVVVVHTIELQEIHLSDDPSPHQQHSALDEYASLRLGDCKGLNNLIIN